MLKTYLNIPVIAEWCAFIAAIFLINKKKTIWRLFIPFLFLTIVAETFGWYSHYVLVKNNNWVFNILMILNISFSIWLFQKADLFKPFKKKLKWASGIFLIFAIGNVFVFQGFWNYDFYTEVLGDIFLAIIACCFFYLLLKEEAFRDIFTYEYFWLSNGLLFSSLCNIILYLFLDSLRAFYKQTNINVYSYINDVLNILLYGSLIISFICRRRNLN